MKDGLLELDHDPAPRPRRRRVSAYDLAQVGFFLFGFPRNGFGSIDVTSRCNLRCRHCYFFEQEEPAEELSALQWVSKLEEIRRSSPVWEFPFFNCSWVGGEPLLRQDVIDRCRGYFRYNTIVTNGTIPIPEWPVSWYVSIDGDEETHDYLRDKKGCYARARRHVEERAHLGITIATCISKANAHCIERAVKDWHRAGAKSMTFDFYTPIAGIEDRELWLPLEERDVVLDRLMALRRIYGDFFAVPERVFRLMRSDRCQEVTSSCLLRHRSFAFDAAGRAKGKCVMGDKADCSRCGCVVPYYLRAITDRRMILQDLGRHVLGRRPASHSEGIHAS